MYIYIYVHVLVLFAQLYLTLCNPMGCRMPGLPVPHHLLKFAQVHVHCIIDDIQPSHPPMPSSPILYAYVCIYTYV